MKHLYYLFVFCLFTTVNGYSQTTITREEPAPYLPPLPKEEPRVINEPIPIRSGIEAEAFDIPGMLPTASPDAAQAKYLQDTPVNLYTGTPIIKIPICGISEAGIGVSISLNYNASGVRAHAVSGWVGLGWELEGLPTLSRIVRGLPDEGKVDIKNRQDYYAKDGFYLKPWIRTGDRDTGHDHEPDIFLLNLGGSSYRFMFDANQKAQFFPDTDIKVEVRTEQSPHTKSRYTSVFKEFKVTLPDGTQYVFTDENKEETAELETHYSNKQGLHPSYNDFPREFRRFLNANSIPSTWYVKKIISPYTHEINFTYHNVKYIYYRLAENESDGLCPTSVTNKINRVFVQSAAIAKIEGKNKAIEFNEGKYTCTNYFDPHLQQMIPYCYIKEGGANREDIDSWTSEPTNKSNSKILQNIIYYDKNTPDDKLRWVFRHDYFTAVSNNAYDLPKDYSYANVGKTHHKRLKMNQMDAPDGSKYVFSYYNGDYNFKSRFTYGVDHWGFSNGHDENINLTGLIGNDYIGQCNGKTISNREVDFSYGHLCSLAKITLTNALGVAQSETAFEYEANEARKDKSETIRATKRPAPRPVPIIKQVVGGLRIREIGIKDLIRQTSIIKKYNYRNSGFLFVQPVYHFNGNDNTYKANSSLHDYLMSESARPIVGYSLVEEATYDGANNFFGKNISYFDQDETKLGLEHESSRCQWLPDDYDPEHLIEHCNSYTAYFPQHFTPEYDFRGGNLVRSEQYNQRDILLTLNKMTYTPSNGILNGQIYSRRVVRMNGQTSDHDYYYNLKKYRLEEQINETYSPDGDGKKITTTTTFTYKDEMPLTYQNTYQGKHNQVVKTSTAIKGFGYNNETYTKYVADFNFDTDSIKLPCSDKYEGCYYWKITTQIPDPATEARAIYELQQKGISSNVIETFGKRNENIISGNYQSYYAHQHALNTLLPKASYALRNIPTTSFTEMTYNKRTGQLSKDPGYGKERIRFIEYTGKGLLAESAARTGPVIGTAYEKDFLKIGTAVNINGDAILNINYKYGQRFNQLSTVTNTNGTEIHYEYDHLGRLISTKDQDGNIIKHYIYQD